MVRLRRGSPALIRDLNRSAILSLIGEDGPIARVEIARRLTLSPAAVTEITRELVNEGLVEQVEQGPSSGGRPPILLGLVGGAAQAIGAKIAADHVAIVRVSLDGEVLSQRTEAFDPHAPDALDSLASSLRRAVAEVGDEPGRLLGIGLGVPGVVQPGGSVDSPHVGWSGPALASRLGAKLNVPIVADNDVNTLAVAERLYGHGRGVDHFVTVTIGRGVGLGIVAAGNPYRGSRGGAGEFGHVAVVDGGPLCVCGNRGCLEAFVSDPALAREAVRRGVVEADAADAVGILRRAADARNPEAVAIYRRAGRVLGRAVGGLVNVLDPQLVILGGEGLQAWSHLATAFGTALDASVFPPLRGVRVVVDPWDDVRWARGAAALVLRGTFTASLYERGPGEGGPDTVQDGRTPTRIGTAAATS